MVRVRHSGKLPRSRRTPREGAMNGIGAVAGGGVTTGPMMASCITAEEDPDAISRGREATEIGEERRDDVEREGRRDDVERGDGAMGGRLRYQVRLGFRGA